MSVTSPSRQLFSVPYNFVLYMTENPATPEALEKLYQTCKFFFTQNPILIPEKIYSKENGDLYNEAKKQLKTTLTLSTKIIPSKIYRFSLTYLCIEEVTITLTEFDLLIAKNKLEKFLLTKAQIIGATADVILAKLPNVDDLFYSNLEKIYTIETVKKLNLIQRNVKFRSCLFDMLEISDTFSIAPFIEFIVKNGNPNSVFEFFAPADFHGLVLEFAGQLRNFTVEGQFLFEVDPILFGGFVTVKLLDF